MWSLKTNCTDCPANPAREKHPTPRACSRAPAVPRTDSSMDENKLQFPSLPATKEDLLDWAYPMRREMQLPILERQGVTHVVCVRQDIEANFIKPNFAHTFRYLVLDIADNPVENIIRFFPSTKEFIDGCLATGGKVLVHGNAGISRRDAFSHVQERRFCINPNVGFVHQLQEYEAIYLAKLTIKMMSPMQLGRSFSLQAGMPGSRKRSLEEDDDFGAMQVTAAQNG
ncbi:Serine/threonine/tyrosine-interacting protein [Liparis tanakae]|uniref:Serine/threonine/tyrosine-interacting protein n=1 Tax=Liparis tanakae TaxID=230148 RepID=A0A4Z2HP43_9TELE|nr:Serine/threonine/tyrosine-interacting protein [Liparis tanakae]